MSLSTPLFVDFRNVWLACNDELLSRRQFAIVERRRTGWALRGGTAA